MEIKSKINYQKKLDEIISNLDYTPRLLLHSCCAPCSSYCLSYLNNYFDITVLYYNPNIEPYEEYLKRKEEQIKLIEIMPKTNKIDIIDCDYDNEIYHDKIIGLESELEGGARCSVCYYLRLEYTANKAKELGYDYFGTTLTVSPYKNSQRLNLIGETLANKYNIKYLYSDFKKKNGYKKSIEYSKEYNLYRQDYCGCIYSKQERDSKIN
ncbi:MAG: epoxyqueuosine reductase QueH [Bacilli bacterium]|nr:epoxyqueuosine reductase QueH [Bacilli bacterium]